MIDSSSHMLHLVCQNHLTNGGSRNRIKVSRLLDTTTDRELAETLLRNDPLYAPGKICTYGTADDFEPVFAELRASFPDWLTAPSRPKQTGEPVIPC